ncbi:D(4) dopamine receptor-like [Elgaria multicarinata webbii]|uniref:D(4) dopamine receptor-like n=1 Tax=Elgaria multicarinata webbii TaxID=159646 RepID=UPI002FCD48DA
MFSISPICYFLLLLLPKLAAALAVRKGEWKEARGAPSAGGSDVAQPIGKGEPLGMQGAGSGRKEGGIPGEQTPHRTWEGVTQAGGTEQPEALAGQRALRKLPPVEASSPGVWPGDGGGGLWQRCGSWTVKTSLICALGLLVMVGNGAVIAVIASSVSGWSRSSRLVLLSLAAADAASALLVVPLNLYQGLVLGPGVAEGAAGGESPYCRAVAFVNCAIFGASLYSLAGVSLERYVAVFFPLHYGRLLSHCRVATLIAAAWLVPVLLLVPLAVPAPAAILRVRFSAAALLCEPDYGSNTAYAVLLAGAIFCPAAGTITFTNLRLWLVARSQRRRGKSRALSGKGAGPKRLRLLQLDTAARILLPVVIAFYVCWGPCIVTILYNSLTQERVHEWVEFAALWLPTGSGFLNCFVYFWINRNFRHKFQRIGSKLCCRARREQRRQPCFPTVSCAVERGSELLDLPTGCSSSVSSSNGLVLFQEGQAKL